MFRKILVTGGAGFVGSHLLEELVRGNHEVTVIDNASTGRIENLSHLGQRGRLVKGDIRDMIAVRDALQGIDAILHLAAIISVPYSMKHPEETYEVNVQGTRNLLEASLRGNVEKFIYVSTCGVYGEPKYLPIDERHPTSPISPYAESKLKAEQACTEFHEAYGLKITILRPFNIYGPRQRHDQYGGVIARFIERLQGGQPPVIYGDGRQTRDFIYVQDAVSALMLALSRDSAVGRILNVATGVPTSINQLAHLLIGLFGVEGVKPQRRPPRLGDIRDSYADIKEATLHLGFEPQFSLEEGLAALLQDMPS